MTVSEITRLSTATNAVIVQLPERKHPGIVVQGDSLQNISSLVQAARSELRAADLKECNEILDELNDILEGYLDSYRQAMETHLADAEK